MGSDAKDTSNCPHCQRALAGHIGGKPCVVGKPLKRADGKPLRLHDLPIFGAMWREDARDIER